MLELQNVKKTFFAGTANEKKALRGVSFTLDDGDFCTVIGSNGAGKSTTLNAIAGVFPIDSGSIKIDGVEISKMPEWKRASMIGRVFQDPMRGTAAGMMISENLAVADRRGRRPTLRWSDRADRNARFAELVKMLGLGLETRMTAHVGLLSGGQRQALTLLMAT
ncbi:MAG: ATP-binding cassette domain-containing protein, partial [Sutterella wadsworthensis]|nr:ATP-binding cassette domain-containing protein [Sutterella wadsworthensis]